MSQALPWDIMRAHGREPCCSGSLQHRVAMSSFHNSFTGSSTLKISSHYQRSHEKTKTDLWANAFALLVRLHQM